ncbi:hypothetical protein ACFVQ9_25915 [Streptomyces goshikiensis]|uniref:hypothetical protein n=1 Tax=Streptomyces goshikiensis TaxID=1942 RepID=UPI0036B0A42C
MSVVTITIPAAPSGTDTSGHWRRVVTGIDLRQRGGYAVLGSFVRPGMRMTVPLGTLVLAVDKTVYERALGPRLGAGRFVESATVRILKARTRGLVEVWSRGYQTAWIHPSVIRRLTSLLRKQQERLARNPERAEQDRQAADKANARRIERARAARLKVEAEDKRREQRRLSRELKAQAKALAERGRRRKATADRKALGERKAQARAAARTAAAERRTAERAARVDRIEQDVRKRRELETGYAEFWHRAERDRVRDLKVVEQVSVRLAGRRLAPGVRLQLLEHRGTLTDGTTTVWWTTQEVTSHSDLGAARCAYRAHTRSTVQPYPASASERHRTEVLDERFWRSVERRHAGMEAVKHTFNTVAARNLATGVRLHLRAQGDETGVAGWTTEEVTTHFHPGAARSVYRRHTRSIPRARTAGTDQRPTS